MPKYKVDFCVVCIESNKVEVKDNNGKLCWYHISDIKKTDMVTKLICQLPDVDVFGRKGRLSFDPECVQDLGWVPDDWKFHFNPEHVKDVTKITKTQPGQRSHPMQLRSASINEVQAEEITTDDLPLDAIGYIRNNGIIQWIKS